MPYAPEARRLYSQQGADFEFLKVAEEVRKSEVLSEICNGYRGDLCSSCLLYGLKKPLSEKKAKFTQICIFTSCQ